MDGAGAWRVVAGLRPLLTDAHVTPVVRDGYARDDTTLHVLASPGSTAHELETTLSASLGRRDSSYWLTRLAGWGAGFLIGGVLLLALAILEIFNGAVGELLNELSLGNRWSTTLLVTTFIIGALIISFVPQALNGGEDGGIRLLVRRWFGREDQAVTRIRRRLRAVGRSGRIDRVCVWNAGSAMDLALACLDGIDVGVELRVHHDELDAVRSRLREAGIVAEEIAEDSPIGDGSTDPFELLGATGGTEAVRALDAALVFATWRATPRWRRALDDSGAWPGHLCSAAVAATLFDAETTASGVTATVRPGRVWLQRLDQDYGLLRGSPVGDGYEFCGSEDWARHVAARRATLEALEHRYRARALARLTDSTDATALFCVLTVVAEREWGTVPFTELLNRYVECAIEQEHYRGTRVLAALLAREQGGAIADRILLQSLSIENLDGLIPQFLVTGNAAEALWIADWTQRFTGLDGSVQRALIHEALGDYAAAESLLQSIEPAIEEIDAHASGSGGRGVDSASAETAVRHALAFAWVLLTGDSAREADDRRRARGYLERAESLLRHGAVRTTPARARQLENYWALGAELEGDLDAAVARHAAAAAIPGVPVQRTFGSMINWGRALRERAVADPARVLATPDQVMDDLAEAWETTMQGYRGKVAIGDTGEAPIGAHNLALVALCRYAVSSQGGEPEVRFAESALRVARDGLDIVASTGSDRKRATLQAEAALAARILRGHGRLVDDAAAAGFEDAEVPENDRADLEVVTRLLDLPVIRPDDRPDQLPDQTLPA